MKKLTSKNIKKIIKLFSKGYKVVHLAKIFKVYNSSIYHHLRKAGLWGKKIRTKYQEEKKRKMKIEKRFKKLKAKPVKMYRDYLEKKEDIIDRARRKMTIKKP